MEQFTGHGKIAKQNIKTKVVHSESKSAWNVISESIGNKYKIARVPYVCVDSEHITDRQRIQALEHAKFISYCFNHSDEIAKLINP